MDCVLLRQGVEDFKRTVAYTDQDGRIKLFRVTARDFAVLSIRARGRRKMEADGEQSEDGAALSQRVQSTPPRLTCLVKP